MTLATPDLMSKESAMTEVVNANEGVVQVQDPLSIDIPDADIRRIIDDRIKLSKQFFEEKYNLST